MNIELNLGKKTKWALVGVGLVILGIIMGAVGGWSTANVGSLLGSLIIIVGVILNIAMLIVAIGQDFDME